MRKPPSGGRRKDGKKRPTRKQISEAMRVLSLLRKTNRGGKNGRPRTTAPRCPCGRMTVRCAKARCHKCS